MNYEKQRIVVLVASIHELYKEGDCGVCISQAHDLLVMFDNGEEWYVPIEHVALDTKEKPAPKAKRRHLLDRLLDKVLAGDP